LPSNVRSGTRPHSFSSTRLGCDASDWSTVLQHLPNNIGTLAFEFRGHGQSSVPDEDFEFSDLSADIHLALEILNVSRPIVVGHSLGGMVGIELTTRRQLSGLILLEGWTSLATVKAAFDPTTQFGTLNPVQIRSIESNRDQTLARFGGDQWRGFWHTVQNFDGYAQLELLDIPVYEVFRSTAREPSETREKLRIPDTPAITMEWVDGAGHYLPHEVPSLVADLCKRMHQSIG